MVQFISYLRVSTSRQGQSGLGLEAQRSAVGSHVQSVGGELLNEFVEIESGKRSDRPVLMQSIAACRRTKATLLIAKLDRLSRNVAFIANLMDSGIPFVAADAPFASPLLIHVLAAVAQFEREQISARTKAALAAAKARGVKLGVHGATLARQRQEEAMAYARPLTPLMALAASDGCVTLRDYADHMNASGSRTREGALWSPGTVSRLAARLRSFDELGQEGWGELEGKEVQRTQLDEPASVAS